MTSMELPQTVEWALHCCWLLAQSNGQTPMPRRAATGLGDTARPELLALAAKRS